MASSNRPGADLIADALAQLGVRVVFGIVGIPVIEVAEAAIARGIKFISFRNEQAASYAASAYGYLTGRPGVLLVVGGPGVLHALAGIGNATANCFPLVVLAGSAEREQRHRGAFQEMDQVAFLAPLTKHAEQPATAALVPAALERAFRAAAYGRPGPAYVDLPADIIRGKWPAPTAVSPVPAPPRAAGDPARIAAAAQLVRRARAPLIIVGKGAAYGRAEAALRRLVATTGIAFLPTPMGKGVVSDAAAENVASARTAALKAADVVLVFGARLNWILHYAAAPKFQPDARIVQVDGHAEELGANNARGADLAILGDVGLVATGLADALAGYRAPALPAAVAASRKKNTERAAARAALAKVPLSYEHSYAIIRGVLAEASRPIVYVSEGANSMDIARSAFDMAEPRMRLDAGSSATMGVGVGYAIAAALARPDATVVAIEGDSAFGFSAMEIDTAVRAGLAMIVFVMNNGGVYHGVHPAAYESGQPLPSTALGLETKYDQLAESLGARGFVVRTPDELAAAARAALHCGTVAVVNVVMDPGADRKLEFAWLASADTAAAAKL
ncbi:thiamine pyrophosphate enzyme, N-terminal TPP binding domain-containing protein [Dipodascopsis tothii]|uniref:thiamine pyrophosphate enzyme, N-terminal TPP binding domain-containing protein n=1 Tax=Dipodascopsis tothii TaxID=44089 RepID=UPI0034CF52BD